MINSKSDDYADLCADVWFLLLLFTIVSMIVPMDLAFDLLNWATFHLMELEPFDVSFYALRALAVLSIIAFPLLLLSHVRYFLFACEEKRVAMLLRNVVVLVLAVVVPIYVWQNVELEVPFTFWHICATIFSSMFVLCLNHMWQSKYFAE